MQDQRDAVTVLVAEDEPVIRLDLVEQLRELGYSVVASCGDGRAAVDQCRALMPDIALLDINMPVMDGLQAAGEIAAGGRTAVVMLTAYGQRDLIDQAVAAGAMGYLVKPWVPGDLAPALELARARYAELRALSSRVEQLSESLETRKLIDRAKSRLMTVFQLTEPEAFRWLQKAAMDRRTSMARVARDVLQGE